MTVRLIGPMTLHKSSRIDRIPLPREIYLNKLRKYKQVINYIDFAGLTPNNRKFPSKLTICLSNVV